MKKIFTAPAGMLLSLASLALLSPLTAHAEPGHPPRHGGHLMKMLNEFDTDNDGTLTRDEITAAQNKRFTEMDTNKDNNVSIDEFEAQWAKQRRNHMVDDFQRLDENGDGNVVHDEFNAMTDKLMVRRDKDNNGELSRDELRPAGDKKKRNKYSSCNRNKSSSYRSGPAD